MAHFIAQGLVHPMLTAQTVQSFLHTFSQNVKQKESNRHRHCVITASCFSIPHPHLGNVVTTISTPGADVTLAAHGRPRRVIGGLVLTLPLSSEP